MTNDRTFLRNREYPTKEQIIGAATRMDAESGKIHVHCLNLIKYFNGSSDASSVGTTTGIWNQEVVTDYCDINAAIDTLVALRDVMFGKPKTTKEETAAAAS